MQKFLLIHHVFHSLFGLKAAEKTAEFNRCFTGRQQEAC